MSHDNSPTTNTEKELSSAMTVSSTTSAVILTASLCVLMDALAYIFD